MRDAVLDYLDTAGNPGRSGHSLARRAEDAIWCARESIAELFDMSDPARVIFTVNATTALNIAIKGMVRPGDRVLTSAFEHNSVTRPLGSLEGVEWTVVPPDSASPIDFSRLETELRRGKVRLVVIGHASNVTGAVIDLPAVRTLTAKYGAKLVIDAAQTAGHLQLSMDEADVIAFSGHKGLFGPQGTGCLLVSENVEIRPLIEGGTGVRSESPRQPRWLPFALESGTPNGIGIAGLGGAVRWLLGQGLDKIQRREEELRRLLIQSLESVDTVKVHGWPSVLSTPTISITIGQKSPTDCAMWLEERYQLVCRAGLHCAPLAHQTLGTYPSGTVRLSFSHLTDRSEIDVAVNAIEELAAAKP